MTTPRSTSTRSTAARKPPQDHKPKALKPGEFVGVDGKTYALPDATESMTLTTGRDLRDMVLGDEVDQVAIAFRVLERSDVDPDVLDALYALPASKTGEVISAWMPEANLPNG